MTEMNDGKEKPEKEKPDQGGHGKDTPTPEEKAGTGRPPPRP